MLDKIAKLFEDVLERNPDSIHVNDAFRDYEEWDSLAYLSIIASIDEDYGIIIPREKFNQLVTLRDIADYIDKNRD